MKTMSFRLSDSEYARALLIAEHRGLKLNELLRRLVVSQLKRLAREHGPHDGPKGG